jgi:hypothetical protein
MGNKGEMDPKGVSIDSKVDCNIRKSVTGILEMEHLVYCIVKEINKLNRAHGHKFEQMEHGPFGEAISS